MVADVARIGVSKSRWRGPFRGCGHPKMKVTFVIPTPSLGGGMRVVSMYASRLRRRGHEVNIVAPPPTAPSLRAKLTSLIRVGWHSRRAWESDLTYFEMAQVPIRFAEKAGPIVDSDVPNADAVIGTWWETAEWVAQLSPSKGAKVYFIQDHEVFPGLPLDRVAATYQMPLHKIVVANWLVDVASKEYHDTDVSLVPDGVDHQLFWAPRRAKNRVPTFGVLYTTEARKTCNVALEAFALAAKQSPEFRLLAFGLQDPIPELPLPAHTEYHFQPPQDRLRDLYARCDAWLFSSRTEGFGMPILEAMACRTPVIGTPAGAAPELLEHGGGILVSHNPREMAGAIQHVAKLENDAWVRMSDRAYETARRCDWDTATVQFEAALRTAIKKQGTDKLGDEQSSAQLTQ